VIAFLPVYIGNANHNTLFGSAGKSSCRSLAELLLGPLTAKFNGYELLITNSIHSASANSPDHSPDHSPDPLYDFSGGLVPRLAQCALDVKRNSYFDIKVSIHGNSTVT